MTFLLLAVLLLTAPAPVPLLHLRPGITSDSAFVIVGASGDRRDTTWTGKVHRRVESITLRSVALYGIDGNLYLGFDKHGRLTGALWNGGYPPPRGELDFGSPSTELTLEDAENVADSLSAELGVPTGKQVDGIEGIWWWNLEDRSHSLAYTSMGMQLSVSQPPSKSKR